MIRASYASMCLLCLAVVAPSMGAAAEKQAGADETPYRVVNGKVDESTFLGWRTFHSACHACHGVDAVGTSIPPSLVERGKQLSARDFTVKVLTSYRLVFPSSEVTGAERTEVRREFIAEELRDDRGDLGRPACKVDQTVQPVVLVLLVHLSARADGARGPGRPLRVAG